MDEADIERIVDRAVSRTLLTLGIDPSNPAEMRRDFQHLRAWRESVQTVKRQGLITAVGVIVTGFLGWILAKATGAF